MIVVNLPFADRVVGLDRATPAERWAVDGWNSMGPVPLADGTVYVSCGDGEIQAFRARDGGRLSSVSVRRRNDHGGRALSGPMLLLASLDGDLGAIAKGWMDQCDERAIGCAFARTARADLP